MPAFDKTDKDFAPFLLKTNPKHLKEAGEIKGKVAEVDDKSVE
jgi:hypothetical protein